MANSIPVSQGPGDELDVAAGRCCPHCRHMLTSHNREVWNAGYSVGVRHTRDEVREAWEAGWHEHYLEGQRQLLDSNHPITKVNPYRRDA